MRGTVPGFIYPCALALSTDLAEVLSTCISYVSVNEEVRETDGSHELRHWPHLKSPGSMMVGNFLPITVAPKILLSTDVTLNGWEERITV